MVFAKKKSVGFFWIILYQLQMRDKKQQKWLRRLEIRKDMSPYSHYRTDRPERRHSTRLVLSNVSSQNSSIDRLATTKATKPES